MFKALKRLVGIEKKQTDSIPFSMIDSWLENKLKETDLAKEVGNVFDEISASLSNLTVFVKKIAVRKITDENSQSVEDYREDYVLKMQSFAKQINLDKKDIDSIINFNENLSAALSQVNESTKNMFSIVKKFFPNEAESISSVLESLEECQEKLDGLIKKDQGLIFVQDIKRRIHDIKKKSRLVEDLKAQIEREEIKQKEAEEYRTLLETDVDDLKSSSEFEKYDVIISKKLRLEKELERENENLRILFSPLLKVFAEYDKKELGSDRALARQYAADPISSLQNDKNLWLMSLLQTVSDRLGDIEQDEKKRLKIRQSVLALSEDVVKNYIARYSLIKEAINQVNKQAVRDNTTLKMEDIKYKLSHVSKQLNIIQQNKQKAEETISQMDVGKDLLMLEKKLNLIAGVKIT